MQRRLATARDVTGLVLTGGQGRRMAGADKGWIEYGGRPLIETACEQLAPQVAELLICASRNLERYASLAPVVGDRPEPSPSLSLERPLAGVLSGLRRAARDWIAIVPCDAPHLPLDFVARPAHARANWSKSFLSARSADCNK